MVQGASAGYDRHITIFSPDGRLYQIEYALKAAKNSGQMSIAVTGKNSTVLVARKKVPDKLLDPSSIRHIFPVTSTIACLLSGLRADCLHLLKRARYEAAEYKFKKGHDISSYYLAKRMANLAQLCTQHSYMRTLGVVMIFGSFDEEGGEVYRVDPSGVFDGFSACAAGPKEQEAMTHLEKSVKAKEEMTFDKTIQIAFDALQKAAGSELKADEMEVAVVDETGFKHYSEKDVEERITSIHESLE